MDVLNLFRWGYDKYEKRKEQETQDKTNRKVIKCIAGIAATGLCLAVFLFWLVFAHAKASQVDVGVERKTVL